MRLKPLILSGLITTTLAGCATAPPHAPLRAEIHNKTKTEVADHLASLCSSFSFSVDDTKDSKVDCSKEGGGMAQFAFGYARGGDVTYHVSFLIVSPRPKTIAVTPQAYYLSQNDFGGGARHSQLPQANQDVISMFDDLNDWGQH